MVTMDVVMWTNTRSSASSSVGGNRNSHWVSERRRIRGGRFTTCTRKVDMIMSCASSSYIDFGTIGKRRVNEVGMGVIPFTERTSDCYGLWMKFKTMMTRIHIKKIDKCLTQNSRVRLKPRKHVKVLAYLGSASESEDPDEILIGQTESVDTKGMNLDADLVHAASQAIATQQAAGLPPSWDIDKTRRLVETAMLAAVAGLAYTIATLMKIEGYLNYILPLPVILSSLRGGPSSAIKSLTVAFLLLFILVGPVRATSFLLIYGFLSLSLGISWYLRFPWSVSVPVSAIARLIGYTAYLGLSSLLLGENLLALAVVSVHSLLDQMSAFIGTSGAPSIMAVTITLISLLAVNSIFYCFMMHILYMILLRSLGYDTGPPPKFVTRLIGQQNPAFGR